MADSCEMNAMRRRFLGTVGVIPQEGRLNSESSSLRLLCWIWQCTACKESHSKDMTIKFILLSMYKYIMGKRKKKGAH